MTLRIQDTVKNTNRIMAQAQEEGYLSKRLLAVGIEINQLYSEYLQDLEIEIKTGVTVAIDGQKIHFRNDEDFTNWLAENIT